ncbi:MAG TPA: ABC transporter permease, partial [Gaiellaceae bacterium]|nr:ABC transporter permease [Gaiellaceae bacterium]
TMQDAAALANRSVAPDVETVAPVSSSSAELVNGSTNWTTTLEGTTPAWATVRSRTVSSGRFLSDADQRDANAVVVLGPDTATELFAGASPLGQTVSDNGVKLEVVGVLEPLSSSDQTSNNDLAVVPQSTYAQKLVGGATRNSVSNLYVKASSAGALSAAYQEANALLLNTHKISTPASADFSIATQQSILAASTSVNDTLTVMLGGIAVIALLVGGIGVMNIMLVSVTERYREIGVRKAIGARPSLIRRQFLVEASMLGLAGGVLGVLLGVIGAVVIPAVTDSSVILSVPASIGAIAIAIGVGVVFGVYPASRAARLSPIDALRSE